MARIRTIKPEFWANEGLSALPEATHLLAAALLNYADDEGYFNANPRLVEAACSPLREPSVRIHESLVSLHMVGYIRLGVGTDGKRYGHVVHFVDHQRVSHPTPSKIATISITWDDENEDFVRPPENFVRPHESLRPEQGIEHGIEREQGKEIIRTTTKNPGSDPEPKREATKRQPQMNGKPAGPNTASGMRLPEHWQPDADLIAWAQAKGASNQHIADQTERFRNYWLDKPGASGRKVGWSRTWQNWITKSLEDRHNGKNGNHRKQHIDLDDTSWLDESALEYIRAGAEYGEQQRRARK